MSLDYEKVHSEPGEKCATCTRGLQHGGYVIKLEDAFSSKICGWCLATVENASPDGKVVEKVKDD